VPATAANHAAGLTPAHWQGSAVLPLLTLHVPGIDAPLMLENLKLHALPVTVADKRHHEAAGAGGIALDPIPLPLGAPAPAVLDGLFHSGSIALHLRGGVQPARLLALAHAIPQLGDGVEEVLPAPADTTRTDHATPPLPIYVDAIALRTWKGLAIEGGISPLNQSYELWSSNTAHKPAARRRR
jgi:AsmA protein